MAIEFNCHVCGKLLRTSEDKAGRTAKCPGCGENLTVPANADDLDEDDSVEIHGEDETGDDEYGDNEHGEEQTTDGTRPCPMCGEQIGTRASRCEFCGEEIEAVRGSGSRGDVRSTQVDVGEVISTSWELFKSEMGVCVGGYVIMMVIVMVVGGARGAISGILNVGVAGMGNQQPGGGAIALVVGFALFAGLIEVAIRLFLEAGFKRLLLKIVRGKNAEVGDLFSAGPFFLRYLGNSILFGLMVGFGSLACLVPGIILALMFWPFSFLILDRNLPGMECLSRAKQITEGNWGAIFLLALAAFGINILGFLALCIGLLFTAPLTMLMFAVAYCRMEGRSTVRV